MSLRHKLSVTSLLILPAVVLGAGTKHADAAVNRPAVETYVDQALPVAPPATRVYDGRPLAAGELAMEDVLKANPRKNKTKPTPPEDTSGLMLSRGMNAVIQKYTLPPAPKPAVKIAPKPSDSLVMEPPVDLAETPASVGTEQKPETELVTVDGIAYVPGQEPKTLGPQTLGAGEEKEQAKQDAAQTSLEKAEPPPADSPKEPASEPVAASKRCEDKVKKWEKTCEEAGYPSNFVGIISGETKESCEDGSLQDFWVLNTCAPPDEEKAPKAEAEPTDTHSELPKPETKPQVPDALPLTKTDLKEPSKGACGEAHGVPASEAPVKGLCSSGIPSSVSGDGPWMWSCGSLNMGQSDYCQAPARNEAKASLPIEKPAQPESAQAEGFSLTSLLDDGHVDTPAPDVAEQTEQAPLLNMSSPDAIIEAAKAEPEAKKEPEPKAHQTLAESDEDAFAKAGVSEKQSENAPAASPLPQKQAPKEDVARPSEGFSTDSKESLLNALEAAAEKQDLAEGSPDASKTQDENTQTEAQDAPAPQESICGESSEILAYRAPVSGLCKTGTASEVRGIGPWTWTCTTGDGALVECSTLSLMNAGTTKDAAAQKVAPTPENTKAAAPKPVCGTSANKAMREAPSDDLCKQGEPGAVKGQGPWNWTCVKGKAKVSCSAPKIVDGSCGTSDGKATTVAPKSHLCATGAASRVSGKGPWAWTCKGSKGGDTVTCSAEVSEILKNKEASLTTEKAQEETPQVKKDDARVAEGETDDKAGGIAGADASDGEPAKAAPIALPEKKDAPAKELAKQEKPSMVAAPRTPLAIDPELSTIVFAHKSSRLDAGAIAVLDKLAEVLANHPGPRIALMAYADGTSTTARAARRLSLQRALAVRDYLSAKGIPETRVDVHAEGGKAVEGSPDRVEIKPKS